MPENKIDEIELRSEEVQDILSKIPHWMVRYGNIVLALLIVMLLVFSWFVKYPDLVTGKIVITTQVPPQKEYARIQGSIKHLLVENNSIVEKGDFLAVLDNAAKLEDVKLLKSIVDTIRIGNGNFVFPIDSIPNLLLGELATDFSVFQTSYLQYRMNKRLGPYVNKGHALETTKTELNSRLEVLHEQQEIMLSELSYKKADLERYQSLHDSKVVSTQEFESRKMEYLQYERNLKSIEISISQLKENITYIERDNRSNEITKTTEEINMYSKSIQSFNQLKKALKEWELKYAFIASLEGKVSFINIWNENQYVRNGDLLFTVVPQINSEYLARLKMPAQNFGKVKKGQEVMIRLENFPDNEFGILSGTVENMSLIPDNNGLYIIEVGLGDKLITNYNKEIDFTQEMSGTAEIITEDLRLIERFFYQLKGLLNRG
jgi:multidrug resistance efflux pump